MECLSSEFLQFSNLRISIALNLVSPGNFIPIKKGQFCVPLSSPQWSCFLSPQSEDGKDKNTHFPISKFGCLVRILRIFANLPGSIVPWEWGGECSISHASQSWSRILVFFLWPSPRNVTLTILELIWSLCSQKTMIKKSSHPFMITEMANCKGPTCRYIF